MAELAASARRRAVAFGGALRPRSSGILAFAIALASCATRDVYLVPTGSADASLAVQPDARPPKSDAPIETKDGAVLHPEKRDAGDSGPRCETNRYTQVQQPLGVYLMVDQSYPMHNPWAAVVAALKDFINESGSFTDVSMGIQYFAVAPTSGTEPLEAWLAVACSAATYSTPEVPIQPLPGNQAALNRSLGQHNPSNIWPPVLPFGNPESPTDLALSGAITGLQNWAQGKTKPKLAVVLVTDGVPNLSLSQKCNAASLTGTQQVAAQGLSGTPSVLTYVLGVGDQLNPLNDIATAGGTDHAYLVKSTAAPSDISAQLQSIRDVALPCELSVDAAHLVRGDVNVELVTGSSNETLSRVPAPADCATSSSAKQWFAEEPDAGGSVVLCPTTCASIRSTKDASLDVVYGCPTMLAK